VKSPAFCDAQQHNLTCEAEVVRPYARTTHLNIALDNVSVSSGITTTPEPASLMLLGGGVLTLGGTLRRKLFTGR
jgi:hypothetical protein